MGFLLGSQVESMALTDTGLQYEPGGVCHAVDPESETFTPGTAVDYAVCGTPVRVWPDRPFEPDAANAHDQCVAIVSGDRPRD